MPFQNSQLQSPRILQAPPANHPNPELATDPTPTPVHRDQIKTVNKLTSLFCLDLKYETKSNVEADTTTWKAAPVGSLHLEFPGPQPVAGTGSRKNDAIEAALYANQIVERLEKSDLLGRDDQCVVDFFLSPWPEGSALHPLEDSKCAQGQCLVFSRRAPLSDLKVDTIDDVIELFVRFNTSHGGGVGLDVERDFQTQRTTAIQVADINLVFVFRPYPECKHLPQSLQDLLTNPQIVKFAVDIKQDNKFLQEDFQTMAIPVSDLQEGAKAFGFLSKNKPGIGLLSAYFLGFQMQKNKPISMSFTVENLSDELSRQQQEYCVTDAIIALEVGLKMVEIGSMHENVRTTWARRVIVVQMPPVEPPTCERRVNAVPAPVPDPAIRITEYQRDVWSSDGDLSESDLSPTTDDGRASTRPGSLCNY